MPAAFSQFEAETWPAFGSGWLLCELISKVERVTIPCIEQFPTTEQQARFNISQALRILHELSQFPQDAAVTVEAVRQGSRGVLGKILDFLHLRWLAKNSSAKHASVNV